MCGFMEDKTSMYTSNPRPNGRSYKMIPNIVILNSQKL